jgi:hypothetical protein
MLSETDNGRTLSVSASKFPLNASLDAGFKALLRIYDGILTPGLIDYQKFRGFRRTTPAALHFVNIFDRTRKIRLYFFYFGLYNVAVAT